MDYEVFDPEPGLIATEAMLILGFIEGPYISSVDFVSDMED